ncbi:MAG: efflux RND transporter periplasmic adaptor subunit [bacterium]
MNSEKPDLSALRINRKDEIKEKSPARKKLIKNIVLSVIFCIILIAVYLLYPKFIDNSVQVETYQVSLSFPSDNNAVLTASGYVVAQRQASVASKGTGRLLFLGVVEGDEVQKNEIIARLEDDDIKAQLLQSQATLKLYQAELRDAEKNLNRQQKLLKSDATTEEIVESAQARYEKALANIDLANASIKASEVNLENMLIRAPFNGTVLTKNADIGEMVSPLSGSATSKSAVVTIADMRSLQVEADVSESNIQKILLNQNCDIVLDAYPNQKYKGYVAKIVPTADRSKATVLVKVGFVNYDKKVLPEMSAKVNFLLEEKNNTEIDEKQIILVPLSSIREIGNRKVVFTITDNMAHQSIITIGRQFGNYYEVVSGLNNGDQIIDKLTDVIKEKTKVKF